MMAVSTDLTRSSSAPQPLSAVGRLPASGDNLAIATRTLAAGTRVAHAGREFVLNFAVLEGHRFAVQPIAAVLRTRSSIQASLSGSVVVANS